jgi:hypothetical protein
VAQMVAALAVQIGPLVEHVHLVDAHRGEPAVLALEHVQQRHRLPVRHRHHDVGVARDVVENRFGRRGVHAATIAGFPQCWLCPTADCLAWLVRMDRGGPRTRMRVDPSVPHKGSA